MGATAERPAATAALTSSSTTSTFSSVNSSAPSTAADATRTSTAHIQVPKHQHEACMQLTHAGICITGRTQS